VPRRHHPGSTVQRRPEIVVSPQLGLTRTHSHTHRQTQAALRVNGRVHSGPGRGEHGANTVARVLEQPTTPSLDTFTQHGVMSGQRDPHRVGVGLPQPGRALDIGEQKRQRSSRPCRLHVYSIAPSKPGARLALADSSPRMPTGSDALHNEKGTLGS
jgi:hypothetical protein